MNEFEFIRGIRKRLSLFRDEVRVGIGDDCAVLDIGDNFLVTVDSAVENIHFKREWGHPYWLGKKLVRVNVSDIYAKGGTPVAAFISTGLRFRTLGDKRFIKKYIDGILDELASFNIQLAGGNVSSVARDMFFDMTLIGKVDKGSFRGRSGALSGDLISVSGSLGDSMAGLMMLSDRRFKRDESLIDRFFLPDIKPLSEMRVWQYVTSSIDISDGLYGDLSHILEESRCGATIFVGKIPVSENLRRFCKRYNFDIYKFAIGGGEDYRMLLTIRADTPEILIEESGLHIIGQIESGSALRIIGSDGKYNSFHHF